MQSNHRPRQPLRRARHAGSRKRRRPAHQFEILDRAEKIGLYFGSRGWAFAHLEPVGPSATELAQGPTFAGYPCSPTVDERGLPTWIIVEGKQAQRREKQGDAWYSVRLADGTYAQVLRIPKGEKPPEVKGL